MSDFHFLRPEWFWVLLPALALLGWMARCRLRSRSWQSVCDPQLLPHLLLGRSVRRANWPLWLLLAGLLLAVVALAGPVWQRQPQPLFRQQSALVILFDLSRSMLADDLKPSRYLRARLKIEDLLRQRREGQTALIAFAAEAFTVTPLTADRHTIESLLKSLEPGLMPVQGSDPGQAMELGVSLLQQAGLRRGRLLLVTDEQNPAPFEPAARQLAEQGFDLAVLGVGTPAGAPIPQAGGGFFKDFQGQLVLPALNSAGLRQLAAAGRGVYHPLTVDDRDLRSLLRGLDDRSLNQPGSETALKGDIWREEGIWLLLPLCLLAACAFRRGWLLLLAMILWVPSPARALSWQDLWQTPNQQAAKAFAQQNYVQAAEQFGDPRWKASALYRAGHYAEAAELLKTGQAADDFYNLGNALARQGDLPAALHAYEQVLEQDPEHADARYNKDLVEKELQQQQQQNRQENQGKNKEQNQKQPQQKDQTQNSAQSQESASSQNSPQTQQGQGQKPPDSESHPQTEASLPSKGEENRDPPREKEQPDASPAQSQGVKEDETQTDAAADSPEPPPESAEERETRLMLQQIPDDPGGLLRRKFLYQSRRRGGQEQTEQPW